MKDRKSTLENAYFYVDNNMYSAFVPLNMISSLHTEKDEAADVDADWDCWNVVLTTVSGREFIIPGFSSTLAALEFCEEQMSEISDYNKALAEAANPNSRDTKS